jgi:GH25 family lysozyme M1 (1,4-beta-N-acetylmuramidase)
MIKGYDVSNVNGPNLIIPGDAEFLIAKVAQDARFIDRLYPIHRTTARQREIGFGGYLYADNKEQPNAEASCDFFLENLGDQHEGEVAALDVEIDSGYGGFDANSAANRPWVIAWGRKFVKAKNYKSKLYTSLAGITDFDLNDPEIAELYDLWLAWWSNSGQAGNPPPCPAPWTEYKLWQYNADTIDKDVFLGTLAELRATGMKKASQPAPAADYEALYWTPMQKLLDDMISSSVYPHADAAFHAAVSNVITLHKVSVGAESPI